MNGSERNGSRLSSGGGAASRTCSLADSIVTAAQTAIVVLDRKGFILEFNPYMERLCGYNREEVQGKDWIATFIPEREREAARPLFEETEGKVGKPLGTSCIVTKSGVERRIQWHNTGVRDPIGEIIGVLAVGQDVTEREWIEEHRQLLSAMVEQSAEGMVLVDFQGMILFANQACASMHGYEALELIGKPISIFHTPEHVRATDAARQQVRDTGQFSGEMLHTRRDGSTFPVLVHGSRLPGDARMPSGIVFTILDITERKRAEELSFRNAILSAQLELSPDGVLVVDEQGKMTAFNQRFVSMWGISNEALSSRSDEQALRSVLDKLADPEGFLSSVGRLYKQRQERSHDYLRLVDGRVFERHSSPMLGPNGQYYGRVWYFRDVTEQRRAEDVLRKSEAHYRAMAQDSPLAFWQIAAGSHTVFINPDICPKLSREGLTELTGKTFRCFRGRENVEPAAREPAGRAAGVASVRLREEEKPSTLVNAPCFECSYQDTGNCAAKLHWEAG